MIETHFHSPFTHYEASVGGYLVPHVRIVPLCGADDGSVNVMVRDMGVLASEDEAKKWLPIVAHAMAVASGHSCHGENCERMNLHKVRIAEIGKIESE